MTSNASSFNKELQRKTGVHETGSSPVSRNGHWVVKQQTAKGRFSRALHRLREWCRWHRHDSLKTQHLTLKKKLEGHYAYYGITSNFDRIADFFYMAKRAWRTALARRSQQRMPWRKMQKLLERFPLPAPRIVHRYPSVPTILRQPPRS